MKLNFAFFKRFNLNKLQRRKKNKKVLSYILRGSLFTIIFLVLFVASAFAWYSKDLPTPTKIASRKATESTKIYDRTGEILLYETGDQKRTIVPGEEISSYLKDATVATEDSNFYRHHGFDTKAILAAFVEKALGRTRRLRGGSTITQQYVKNSFLSSDRSAIRKFKELILSIELEFMYSKDQILAMYLNEIPYGNGTAGAEAASSMYFGKKASNLSIAEAATLAAIPQAPSYYSPYGTHVKELVNRRNYVIDRMVELNKITKDQGVEAKAADTTTMGQTLRPRRDSLLAPHFAMYVIDQVANEYGEDKIQKEGMKIVTTLDYHKQQDAEKAIAAGVQKLDRYGASNAALVAVDPKTNEILAMVGSKDYYDAEIDGNVNVADSLRQPGSSFKPIAYATAFKKPDFSPSKIIFDLETDFGGGYVPNNYNGKSNGPVTIRQALANSLNIPAVKILSLAGIDNVIRTAEDLGITSLTDRSRYGLSLVLGAGEVSPLQMASAFGVFGNQGVYHDQKSVLKITDSKGKVLYEYKQEEDSGKIVLDPQIAYEISSILSDDSSRGIVFGTHYPSLYFPDRAVALKTGTTSDFKDAWTVGYTPSIATAIWVGNSNGSKMKNGADGSVLAAPIFHNFIVNTLKDSPNETFSRPEGIQDITVEKYSNKIPNQASKELTTDIFASWQVPTEKDDIHQIIKVCKTNGKLAPDDLPTNLIEEKIFTILHSERPDYPNWEGPVSGWASQNGMNETVPTDKCDAESILPTISFSQPKDASSISGENNIEVNVVSPYPVKHVEFFIDDISIGQVLSAPYSKKYNFNNLSKGNHKITALVTDQNDSSVKSDINIKTVDGGGATISEITTKTSPSQSGTKNLLIGWKTDSLTTGKLSATSLDGITSVTGADTSSKFDHQVTMNLPSGKNYKILITAIDDNKKETTAEKLVTIE